MPMKPACFSGDWMPGAICLLSSGRTLEALRSGEAASNSRHGALEPGTGLPLCVLLDRGLQLFDRQQHRRDHRSRGAAAARARAFRQIGIADPDLDLMRLEPEFARDRIGDHGAAAGADILRRGAGDRRPPLTATSTFEPGCQR